MEMPGTLTVDRLANMWEFFDLEIDSIFPKASLDNANFSSCKSQASFLLFQGTGCRMDKISNTVKFQEFENQRRWQDPTCLLDRDKCAWKIPRGKESPSVEASLA